MLTFYNNAEEPPLRYVRARHPTSQLSSRQTTHLFDFLGILHVPTREPVRTPREVLAFLREREVKAVDLRFMDFPGLWKHFTIPAEVMTEDIFEEGYGFDGSSL